MGRGRAAAIILGQLRLDLWLTRVLDELTDERLGQMTQPILEPGYPESRPILVLRCLSAVVNEEWLHREYAERDLAYRSKTLTKSPARRLP